MAINVSFNFNADTPYGKDPDTYSHSLHSYHRVLWTRKLPNGEKFNLKESIKAPYYLFDEVNSKYSSDSLVQSFKKKTISFSIKTQQKANKIREKGRTIGGYIIFPAYRIDNKQTINAARGFHPKIRDRFDLTLECIRLYYEGNVTSPLTNTLNLYKDFLNKFVSFKEYVKFFYLDPFVDESYNRVTFLLDFKGFNNNAIPTNENEYLNYLDRVEETIEKRTQLIKDSF